MNKRRRATGRRGPNLSPRSAGAGGRAGAFPRLRFDRTVGFWLGASVLGTVGCFVGFAMPYHHPVAVTANVLWWGVFLGCLGGSVCAVLGLWAEPTRPSPAPRRRHSYGRRPAVRRGPSRFSGERRRRF
jgi:hypothetical protein